jgi:hypothetical protein
MNTDPELEWVLQQASALKDDLDRIINASVTGALSPLMIGELMPALNAIANYAETANPS